MVYLTNGVCFLLQTTHWLLKDTHSKLKIPKSKVAKLAVRTVLCTRGVHYVNCIHGLKSQTTCTICMHDISLESSIYC